MRVVTVAGAYPNGSPEPEGHPGAVRPDGSIVSLAELGHPSVLALIEAGPDAWAAVEEQVASPDAPVRWTLGSVRLLAPVPRPPRNMVCVGVNYQSHFDEGKRPEGTTVPESPVLFTKPWTSLSGHDEVVPIDRRATDEVDWEAELAVVVGRGGINIAPEQALDHVFGWTLANDLSARDLQLEKGMFGQWHKGKSLDGFCPLGPWIVTRSELADYRDVALQLRVNGVVKQQFRAGDMINSVERIIARVSLGQRLLPGDVILTGTAAGVGHWRTPREFLHGGDVVEIESDALGLLRTRFAES